jgi:SAM-dependent methyltransferase
MTSCIATFTVTCPICSSAIVGACPRRKCPQCGNADRTRSVFLLYSDLLPITRQRHALIFTEENWLNSDHFATFERSIYLGENSLDIQRIARPDNSYEWVVCNHVLEHVAKDAEALKEMFRVLRTGGILQLTIPTPSKVYHTFDWGFPDPNKVGHYRNYGADFIFMLSQCLPTAYVLSVVLKDTLSSFHDLLYFICKGRQASEALAEHLIAKGYLVVPCAFPSQSG